MPGCGRPGYSSPGDNYVKWVEARKAKLWWHLMESGGEVEDNSQGSLSGDRSWSSSQSGDGNTARPQTCQRGRLKHKDCYPEPLFFESVPLTFSEGGVTLVALEAFDVEDAVPRLHD